MHFPKVDTTECDSWRNRSWFHVLTVVFLSAAITSCGIPGVHRDFGFLNGAFVTDAGVRAFLDRHWRFTEDRGLLFRNVGTLLVWVEGEAPDSLNARLLPEGETAHLHFTVLWDGRRLWDRPVAAGDSISVDLSSDHLGPGLHRLTIERVKDLDGKEDTEIVDNVFAQIELQEVRDGEAEPVEVVGNAFIASFLDFGVTGQTPYRFGGCLFDGPQRLTSRIACPEESRASITLENQSRESATFSIFIGDQTPLEFEVQARSTRHVQFPVAAGEHELALGVEGYEKGSFLWGAPDLRPVEPRPASSVFFITLDTTRWDAVAPFSAAPDLTPNISAFAAGATVFSNAWAVAPWTLPSHASMFTGLYPSHHGAGVLRDVLDDRWVTLAERFRDCGYVTGGFVGGHLSSSVFGLAQGFSVYLDPKGWERRGDRVTESALDFIETHAGSPQFVFINYFDPHERYEAPAKYEELAGVPAARRAVAGIPVWGKLARGEKGAWAAVRDGKASDDAKGLAFLRAAYLAEVAFMDAQLGRVFEKLRNLEIYDDALIVIVADHGEFLGEGGRYSHSYSLDPELTRVPLLVKWPQQKTRIDINELVSHIDLYPAVAAAAGLDVPASDGVGFTEHSISNLERRDLVMMEEHACRVHPLLGRMWIADHLFGLQWREHREIIFDGQITCEDLREGAWSSAPCDVGWEARAAMLDERMRAAGRLDADHNLDDLDPEDAEKLRALGYLE